MKAATRIVEIQGIEIAIPVGSMDPPTAESEVIMWVQQDKSNWKLSPTPYTTHDKRAAEDLAYCYNWYFGGHEFVAVQHTRLCWTYTVTSKGYYHYVGI